MNQKWVWIISSILYIWKVRGETCNKNMAYYEELISKHVNDAKNYIFPKNNGEFFPNLNESEIIDFGTYDFIIVGAGATGSVLAKRLSEISHWKILIIEAGGFYEDDFSNIPAYTLNLQFSKMNWGYFSTRQTSCCLGMIDHKCNIPRGKSLGGSTAINAMLYVRGNKHDYDNWANLGNSGWSYQELLPYFIKSENATVDGDSGYHGEGGPLKVQYSQPQPEFVNIIHNANKEIGHKYVVDYNGRTQMGYSRPQYLINKGKRWSTAHAYLYTIINKRQNVFISTNSLASKILINETNKQAYGVEFVRNGRIFRAMVSKEVIVSSGAINSPQLLMLSGIGPRTHLESLEINVLQDLPVGKFLQDHPYFMGLNFRTNFTIEDNDFYHPIESYLRGEGPLTLAGGIGVLGFFNTENKSSTVPELEYLFALPNTSRILNTINYDEAMRGYENNIKPITDFRLVIVRLHPKSEGTVTLKSKNPIDFPNIDLNMLSDLDGEDIQTLYRGIKYVLNIIDTKPFRAINTRLLPLPICQNHPLYSRVYWFCVIRHVTGTLYHPTGTTRMGPYANSSVVNNNLQVHGMKSLRVADAGVFPTPISGHNEPAAVVVGEKLADILKQCYEDDHE